MKTLIGRDACSLCSCFATRKNRLALTTCYGLSGQDGYQIEMICGDCRATHNRPGMAGGLSITCDLETISANKQKHAAQPPNRA